MPLACAAESEEKIGDPPGESHIGELEGVVRNVQEAVAAILDNTSLASLSAQYDATKNRYPRLNPPASGDEATK